jgi:hypothetical protein
MDEFAGRRAAAYWFSDGLPELAFGLALAACGGVGLAWVLYFPYPWMRLVLLLASAWLLALYLWDRKILDVLKTRLTYPRTGYAQPPRDGYPEGGEYTLTLLKPAAAPSPQNNVTAFRMGTVYIFFCGSLWVSAFEDRWGIAIAMLVIGFVVYWGHKWSERPYSWWSVLPLALTGIPVSILAVPLRAQKFVPMVAGGLWLCCRGAWTLARYLRTNRPRQITEGMSA